jgi:hypothetical protein
MNVDDITTIAAAAKEAGLPVKDVSTNLLDEPTKEFGGGLGSMINVVFFPFHFLKAKGEVALEKIEVLKKEIQNGVSRVPDKNKVDPQLSIVGPALEATKYHVEHDEIRKLIVNLIVASINVEKQEMLHPSFPEIVKQLSPFDVKVLRNLVEDLRMPFASIIAVKDKTSRHQFSPIPIFTVITNYLMPFPDLTLDNLTQYESAIENLIRLSIIETSQSDSHTNEGYYDRLETHPILKETEEFLRMNNDRSFDDYVFEYRKGSWSFTQLGKMFINCCMHDSESDQ